MTVYLVGAGPGDPGLLTRRGAELLGVADVVVYDRLVDPALLLLARPGAELLDVGKSPGDGTVPEDEGSGATRQDEINGLLVRHGLAGRTVVRLKGGDPFLFGRGGEEAAALSAAGVGWEVVPGVPSAFAVPAVAGVPVTHRGVSTSVTVVTGHVGDPTAPGGVDWESLGRAGGTLVVLMGMATRAEIARRLLDAGRAPTTPVTVVSSGTTPEQRIERTSLEGLEAVTLDSPAVIVIGPVAALALGGEAGDRGPLEGVSVVLTRPRDHGDNGLEQALRAAGARTVSVPVIEIADPEDGGRALAEAVSSLGRYRWVAFTSANAVRRVLPLIRDARAFGETKVAAVGPSTAAALASFHVVADLVPERWSGAALVGAFPAPDAPGQRVLFPGAARSRPTLPAGLRAKGWAVDEVAAYRTVPAAPPGPAVLPLLAAASAITFASPSAVDAYTGMRVGAGDPLPVPPVVACIGPVTAAAARAAGLTVALEPASASSDALVAALSQRFGAERAR